MWKIIGSGFLERKATAGSCNVEGGRLQWWLCLEASDVCKQKIYLTPREKHYKCLVLLLQTELTEIQQLYLPLYIKQVYVSKDINVNNMGFFLHIFSSSNRCVLKYLGKYQTSVTARAVEIFFSNGCVAECHGIFSL